MKWGFLVLRIALGLIFLYAGWVKTAASDQFLYALIPFTFLPIEILPWIARILPLVEIGAGVLLLSGLRRTGASLVLILCLIFIGVLTWALANDIIVACACFGQDETPSAAKMGLAIARDVILSLAALAIMFEKKIIPKNQNAASS